MNSMCRISRPAVPASSLQRVIDDFFTEPFAFVAPMVGVAQSAGDLPVDISEDDTSYTIRANVPGFTKEEVEVTAHNGVLTIKAEHAEEQEEKTERFHRRERRTQSLFRTVGVPGDFTEDKTTADLRDGVLTVRLAKTPKNTPRKISVN
ncbi:MAG: Hsp20/alpha crystallin family protein [Planctomycetes bacterium]|nr:Hsp20/alpha crystallin family protein [Planctomycetota bacterium]